MALKLPPRTAPRKKLLDPSSFSARKPKKYKVKYYGSQQIKKTQAWKLFSQFIRQRAGGSCFTCSARGDWRTFHAGHYIAGNVCGKTLFLDERQVQSQCPRCNLFLHGNAPAYSLALLAKYGGDILATFDQIRREEKEKGIICRFSKEELKEIELKYLSKLKTL